MKRAFGVTLVACILVSACAAQKQIDSMNVDMDNMRACRSKNVPIDVCRARVASQKSQCDTAKKAAADEKDPVACMTYFVVLHDYAARLCEENAVSTCVDACNSGESPFACMIDYGYAAGGNRLPRDMKVANDFLEKGCALKDDQCCARLEVSKRPQCSPRPGGGTCHDMNGGDIATKDAAAYFEKGCQDGKYGDCEEVVKLMDQKIYAGIPAERATACRKLCKSKDAKYTRYCGLLKDMGEQP